jgi:hypothetical protein
VALSKHGNDETGRTQPSLNIGIPQYSALKDRSCRYYFKRTLNLTENTADEVDTLASFIQGCAAKKYLVDRKKIGAGNNFSHEIVSVMHHDSGYTRRLYGGHLSVPTSPLKQGYHGSEGYRRNTPNLRMKPSVFDYEGI